jgi:short subunit dehydrogenase-like uncharacterized protein
MVDRELDLVLFGATGFTGQLVAEYLVGRRAGVRWALGGRSREKLERVRAGLAALDPAARELPLVIGDSADRAAMDDVARRAKVVCTTVGPYDRYGATLVAACAEAGTAYCDLTGETPFMRRMIDRHHARAAQTGARIVHACGFDSIPSDLGVLMVHDELARRGDALAVAHFRLVRGSGGVSGGTVASMMTIAENVRDPVVRRAMGDPYALDPDDGARGPDGRDPLLPGRDEGGRFTAPFVMGPANTRVVRRSNALLGYPYGRDFRYDEAIDTGRGLRGAGRAAAVSAGLVLGLAVIASPAGRRLAGRFLPAPGEGPDRETRQRGRFRVEIRAVGRSGARVVGVVAGDLDPGYGQTAVMLGETALALAADGLPERGGVLTPASALGMPLVERLRSAGMTFRVE